MRIALLTVHNSTSQGGQLQAFAMQRALQRLGRVTLLNYETAQFGRNRRLVRLGVRPRSLLSAGKDLLQIRRRRETLARFLQFRTEHLNYSEPLTREQLQRLSLSEYDALVVGSDQVWNPKVMGTPGFRDASYLLGFASAHSRKIAYAPSAGGYAFERSELDTLVSHLRGFHRVSVREQQLGDLLADRLSQAIPRLPDPTILVGADEWRSLSRQAARAGVIEGRYLFFHGIRKTPLVAEALRRISAETGLPVVASAPWAVLPRVKHIRVAAGPLEFVQMISEAEHVLTDSFHATVFAAKFGVPFTSLSPGPNVVRISEFLAHLGLESRLIRNARDLNTWTQDVNFEGTPEVLSNLAATGNAFLREALG